MKLSFDACAGKCATFAATPPMLAGCLLLSLVGIAGFALNLDHLMNGINLAISIVTVLLMPILLITQNRDAAAMQAKLDEMIAVTDAARDTLIGVEKRPEAEINELRR